jgi:tetratricopeptide (TPR) repeat protein
MNPTGFDERVLFSTHLPEAVNRLLQAGVAASHADKPQAERLFKKAQQMDRSCLQTYFALYKFYFYQGRLQDAEREVICGLEEASRQGNFPVEYRRLARESLQEKMYASEAALFYLYTLKALAFIKLRLGQEAEARRILAAIAELDPEDRCGASVIMSLAEALVEEAA